MSKEIEKKKKNKGFTLIEILVAVLILAILVAIAAPSYMRAVERSRTSDPINTLKSIAKAEQVQRLRTGEYTNQTQDLDLQIKDYPAGNTVAGDTFEGQYYTYKVYGEDKVAATATRKGANEGEEDFYELSIDYRTGELFCRPAEHKICLDLGLEAGVNYSEPVWGDRQSCSSNGTGAMVMGGYINCYTKTSSQGDIRVCGLTRYGARQCSVFNSDNELVESGFCSDYDWCFY